MISFLFFLKQSSLYTKELCLYHLFFFFTHPHTIVLSIRDVPAYRPGRLRSCSSKKIEPKKKESLRKAITLYQSLSQLHADHAFCVSDYIHLFIFFCFSKKNEPKKRRLLRRCFLCFSNERIKTV